MMIDKLTRHADFANQLDSSVAPSFAGVTSPGTMPPSPRDTNETTDNKQPDAATSRPSSALAAQPTSRAFNKLNSFGRQLLCGFVGGTSTQSGKTSPGKHWHQRSWTSSKAKQAAKVVQTASPVPSTGAARYQRRHSSQSECTSEATIARQRPSYLARMIAEQQLRRAGDKQQPDKIGPSSDHGPAPEASARLAESRCQPAESADRSSEESDAQEPRRLAQTSGAQLARSLGLSMENCSAHMERLIGLLAELEQVDGQTSAQDGFRRDSIFHLEKNWTEFVRLPGEKSEPMANKSAGNGTSSLRLQQDAIWELLTTEQHYIKCLSVVVDTFLATLHRLQKRCFLQEVEAGRLAGNVDEILRANRNFWSMWLLPMLRQARASSQPMDPTRLHEAFTEMRQVFAPYYRYCLEHSACLTYMKDLSSRNELFRVYLIWCESRRQCERLKLCDLLAKPMQRLTRYSLLLKAIEKRTERSDHRRVLDQMLAYTSRFVLTVDLELRRKDELELLVATSRRLETNECYSAIDNYNEEIRSILRGYSHFDLLAPLFANCPFECRRQLLFDSRTSAASGAGSSNSGQGGQLKFRDPLTGAKVDVVLLIFTDCLLLCKQMAAGSPRNQPDASSCNNTACSPAKVVAAQSSSQFQAASHGCTSLPQSSGGHKAPVDLTHLCPQDSSISVLLSPSRARSLILTKEEVEFARRKPNKSTSVNLADDENNKTLCTDRVCSLGDTRNTGSGPRAGRFLNNHSASNCSLSDPPVLRRVAVQPSSHYESVKLLSMSEQQQVSHCSHLSLAAKTNELQGGQSALKAIRSPYPIERLVMHESRDGLSTVCCQLNDSLTVANFFVLYCPASSISAAQQSELSARNRNGSRYLRASAHFESSRSDSESVPALGDDASCDSRHSSDGQRNSTADQHQSILTPAGCLVNAIKQAQVRYQLAANFHKVRLVTLSSLLGERQPEQLWSSSQKEAQETSSKRNTLSKAWHSRSSKLKSSARAIGRSKPAVYSRGANETCSTGNCVMGATNAQDSSDNAFSDTQLDCKPPSVSSATKCNERSASSDYQYEPTSHEHRTNARVQSKAKTDPMLKAIIEQHQLMLINHSQHDMLATHEYRYPILDRNYLHVRPVAISLSVSHSTSELGGSQARDCESENVRISELANQAANFKQNEIGLPPTLSHLDSKHLLSPSSHRALAVQSSASTLSSRSNSNSISISVSRRVHPQPLEGSPQTSACGSSDLEQASRVSITQSIALGSDPHQVERQLTNSSSSSARSSPMNTKSSLLQPRRYESKSLSTSPDQRICFASTVLPPMTTAGPKVQDTQMSIKGQMIAKQCTIRKKSASRRHLSVLKRQHVILSASSDHPNQQLVPNPPPITHLAAERRDLSETCSLEHKTSVSVSTESSDKLIGGFCSGESRRHLFSVRHSNMIDNEQRVQETSEQASGTLDDGNAEMPTLSHSLLPEPIACCQCGSDRTRATSFELGDLELGSRRNLGIESLVCPKHSYASSEGDARSASMETPRLPVEVSVTLTAPGSFSQTVEVERMRTPGSRLVPRRIFKSAEEANDLEIENCWPPEMKVNKRQNSSCISRSHSPNANRPGSQLTAGVSVASSIGSLYSLSVASNSAVFIESDLEQIEVSNSETSRAPSTRQILPRLNVTTASPQDLNQSYEFPEPAEEKMAASTAYTTAGGLKGKGAGSSMDPRFQRCSCHSCLERQQTASEEEQNLSSDNNYASRRATRPALTSMSADNLGPRFGMLDLGALRDINCITRLVRQADCGSEEQRADGTSAIGTSSSIDEPIDGRRGQDVYLGFHEKIERHNRRLKAEGDQTMGKLVARQDPSSPSHNEREINSSPSAGKWPFAQLRRRAQPLISLFPMSSKPSIGHNQRDFNLTRSMTGDLFESLLRMRPTRRPAANEPVQRLNS